MIYIKTFESYLKGGRSPLYHWIKGLGNLIEKDTLYMGNPAMDKFFRRHKNKDQIKSLSFSRSPNFSYGSVRIVLDTDLLIRDGYIPKPFDEYNHGYKKSTKSLHYKKLKSVIHNLDKYEHDPIINDDEEYEERIYKDIKNIGKYILYIDSDSNNINIDGTDLINYIKKYPQIKVRKIDTIKVKKGKEKYYVDVPTDRGKIILDINMINKMEREKEIDKDLITK